jgi:flagellar biosynthesis protein FlhF
MREALDKVRTELGPAAAVLHTREVRRAGLVGWVTRGRVIEITASDSVNVPSRLPVREQRRAIEPKVPSAPALAQSAVSASVPLTAVAAPATREIGNPPLLGTAVSPEEDNSLPANSYAPAARHPASYRLPTPSEVHGMSLLDRPSSLPAHLDRDYRAQFRTDLKGQVDNLHSMVEQLSQTKTSQSTPDLPAALFHVFTDLIEADVSEETARELIERVRLEMQSGELNDLSAVKDRLARLIEAEMYEHGPIRTWRGQRRVVALVGPTGVGKTTTVAKLAANYRLREKLRVGLITVDTYRIAAVEQLRTYADIIDLPMEVVSTPREMREAVARMHDMDLVLMDTAGRSPRDEVKIQELKSLLAEAQADEVHLVLSCVGSAGNLATTAEKFSAVGTTALIMTKLDEATGLGNVLPLLRRSRLPLSYLTNGQNVPDDIAVADKRRMARSILGMI